MTDFESSIQHIPYPAERIFAKLSDMSNLEALGSMLGGKVKEFTCDRDFCSFNVDPLGSVSIRISERDPFKRIKLVSEHSPVDFIGWIEMAEDTMDATRFKLTLRIDLPFFLEAMVSSKIKDGIEKAAHALAGISY